MEKLAEIISKKIAGETSCSKESQEVIEYGIIAILQTIVISLFVLLPALFLGIFIQTFTFFISVSFLRRFSGGVHASSITSCTVISIISCLGFAYLAKYFSIWVTENYFIYLFGGITFITGFIVSFIKVPVDSPNKPIKNKSKIKELKIKSISLLLIYLTLASIFVINFINDNIYMGAYYAILFAVLWQSLSLTYAGQILLGKADRFIYGIINMKGGHSNEKS